jgi:CDP-diacylglycerol--glycerol-3-phosphate 3-phosphatidyltransferase
LTIPNFITMARLLSVPLIVWLMIADRYVAAMLLFIIAGISDAADGFIAKRFGASSELGAYLDPVADKALLVSVFATLGFKGVLPAWVVVLVVSRDILSSAASSCRISCPILWRCGRCGCPSSIRQRRSCLSPWCWASAPVSASFSRFWP